MIVRRKAHIHKGEFWKIIRMLLFGLKNPAGYIKEWEDTFARYIGVKHAVAVDSGRAGMELILKSLNLNQGDEIIIPAYTLRALVHIIQKLGLTAVPADIDVDTFNIDPDSIIKKITGRTKVIIATHMFGSPCKIDKILKIAKEKSILVIEDCAHSAGTEFHGQKTGSFGYASFFSFETIKPINTYGGGMIVTNHENLAEKIRQTISNYKPKKTELLKKIIATYTEKLFLPTPLSFPALYLLTLPEFKTKIVNIYRSIQKPPSMSGRYTGMQALFGLEKIKILDERNIEKRKKADLLKSLLNENIKPQVTEQTNYYFFVALLKGNPQRIRQKLLFKGIDAGIEDEIADNCAMVLNNNDCKNANRVFNNAIQIPLYEDIPDKKIRYIAKTLNSVC
ncbi:MAG: aminotransferase class I/II-fold pyridoxal phosphate-dependent enzyme [Elusimicrobia bacterium]|nr:aminotransferase class I/II-fold pyridoxal phosphate-dependent enzyme [Elusimicrobiota bacterium]